MRVGIGVGFGRGVTGEPPTPSVPFVASATIAPASGTVGDTFVVSVSSSGWPIPALTYQWRLDTVNISGATGSSYETDTAGSLDVVVTATNSEGEDSATASAVTVSEAAAGIGEMAIGTTFQVAA